jgi:hypothetical protein
MAAGERSGIGRIERNFGRLVTLLSLRLHRRFL